MTAENSVHVDYTGISEIYDSYRSYPDDVINKIIKLGRIVPGKQILDLGCGTGNISQQIKNKVIADFIGIDASPDMLKVAESKHLEVVLSDIDKHRLPFRDGSFDTVVGAYVIHQVNNLNFVLSECYRVLGNGALVLLTSSHKQIEAQHPIIKDFFPSYVGIDKRRFPDIEQVYSLLESLAFKDIKHKEVMVSRIPIDRDYLQKVKNKYVSTYDLMPETEFQNGIARLEAFIESGNQPEFRDWHGTLICGVKEE
jgi:ubiquinone/menaquinone biosynthesis C-methylase UbiE